MKGDVPHRIYSFLDVSNYFHKFQLIQKTVETRRPIFRKMFQCYEMIGRTFIHLCLTIIESDVKTRMRTELENDQGTALASCLQKFVSS